MTQLQSDGVVQRIVKMFLTGNLSVMLVAVSLLAGASALYLTPREEEPQIVVPLADVMISAPGMSAREVERQVTTRLEKLLYQIDGVEYVYSMSRPDSALVTVRFYVGQDRERSLVKLHTKLQQSLDQVPPGVSGWVVKPVEIDDVPIVNVTLYSDASEAGRRYGDVELRRIAEELEIRLQAVANTGRTAVVGGRPRRVRVLIDPERLAGRGMAMGEVERALRGANVTVPAGSLRSGDRESLVEAGVVLGTVDEVAGLVVGVRDGLPVYLRDVAEVELGTSEPDSYTMIGIGAGEGWKQRRGDTLGDGQTPGESAQASTLSRGARERETELRPSVTVSVAKRKGANAVWVSEAVRAEVERLAPSLLPAGVHHRITRDYGHTANDKVNELVEGLAVAIAIVIALLALTMGWREALVVAAAVPITFALTLMVNHLLGFSINRVTLFALILALGLVVDDPIVDVENIHRHFKLALRKPIDAVIAAVNEVRPPIILATLAVIVSFVPMFFITGMMGPYMRPMALNVPLAMLMSLLVAFTITPWMSLHLLKGHPPHKPDLSASSGGSGPDSGVPHAPKPDLSASSGGSGPDSAVQQAPDPSGDDPAAADLAAAEALRGTSVYRLYAGVMDRVLHRRGLAWLVLGVTALLFLLSCVLPLTGRVPLKMLPLDNKNEFQVVIDMPEGTTLERTAAVTHELARYLQRVREVTDVTTYVGLSSPMDFNAMVRHYYLRQGSNVADIRVNLVGERERTSQSHELVMRLRPELEALARPHGARIKLVEPPPGPPVLSTLTVEVYGRDDWPYRDLVRAARVVEDRLARERAVVDIDSVAEADPTRWVFEVDKEKAALSGWSTAEVAGTIAAALGGRAVGVLHAPDEVHPLPIELRLPEADRSSVERLSGLFLPVSGMSGPPSAGPTPREAVEVVQLGEIGRFVQKPREQTIYHKNLRPVVFVYGEMAGRAPAEAILSMMSDMPDHLAAAGIKPGVEVVWAGEGEWKITLDAFRDLGLAFAAACVGIYILLVYETGSYLLPVILMISIPLTVIGIMPGFWLLNGLWGGPIGPSEGLAGAGATISNPVFFTATAMIGMIALSGIAVRNAILLIDFIHAAERRGLDRRQAILDSGAVRLRPIFLTAGTSMLASIPITLDPIFSGLAWALIFGLLVSTAFTLVVIPAVYWLVYGRAEGVRR